VAKAKKNLHEELEVHLSRSCSFFKVRFSRNLTGNSKALFCMASAIVKTALTVAVLVKHIL
jgi:hypothetical protein